MCEECKDINSNGKFELVKCNCDCEDKTGEFYCCPECDHYTGI